MENITLGQIVIALGVISGLTVLPLKVWGWYKKNFTDRFAKIDERLDDLEERTNQQEKEMKDSKEERLVMINGLLACLKGLHNDLHCNGPVTKGITEIETYLINKSHE